MASGAPFGRQEPRGSDPASFERISRVAGAAELRRHQNPDPSLALQTLIRPGLFFKRTEKTSPIDRTGSHRLPPSVDPTLARGGDRSEDSRGRVAGAPRAVLRPPPPPPAPSPVGPPGGPPSAPPRLLFYPRIRLPAAAPRRGRVQRRQRRAAEPDEPARG
eukprot:tig00020801_g13932.t1